MWIQMPDGKPTSRLKTLLPNTINPHNLTKTQLIDRGIAECTITRDEVAWHQRRGAEIRDLTTNPVTIHYPAIEADLETVKTIAKQRMDDRRDQEMNQPIKYMGHSFQCRPQDRENIMGAALDATMWIAGGNSPDDQNWGGNSQFGFISLNNDIIPMTAKQMIDFARTVKIRNAELIFKTRALKDQIEQAQTVAQTIAVEIRNSGDQE